MNHTADGPSTPKARSKRTTRNQRLQIKTLQNAGLKQNEISIQLGLTLRQVGYAIAANNISPKKAKGR
ncbi:hypothetical protein K3495_g3237 [Podosphaera aphanis]|nr:hypothetical protein K3495_g3237 [Podosphaera aphanis]